MHYSPDLIKDWGRVLQKATNATLMHEREFLAYHPSDKFQDCSVILYENSKPMAVFAAHKEGEMVYSHQGLSYAGLIQVPCSFDQKIEQFKIDLMSLKDCKKPFTMILDDPAGNSYIQVCIDIVVKGTKVKLELVFLFKKS